MTLIPKVYKIWFSEIWAGIIYILSDFYHTGYLGYNLFEVFYPLKCGLRNAKWEIEFGKDKTQEMIWREILAELK